MNSSRSRGSHLNVQLRTAYPCLILALFTSVFGDQATDYELRSTNIARWSTNGPAVYRTADPPSPGFGATSHGLLTTNSTTNPSIHQSINPSPRLAHFLPGS